MSLTHTTASASEEAHKKRNAKLFALFDEEKDEDRRRFYEHFKLFWATGEPIIWDIPEPDDVLDEETEKLRSSFTSGWSWIPLDRDYDDRVAVAQTEKNENSSVGSLSNNKVNKSLYFCVRNFDTINRSFGFKWYTIDCKEDGNSSPSSFSSTNPCPDHPCTTTLSPVIETMPPEVPDLFTAVAFGSRIYLIGGLSRSKIFHTSVFYYDTAHPHHGWKQGPSMITGRSEPSVVVVLGKIYAFGGTDIMYNYKWPYAEVLDPTLDRWEVLPELPQKLPNITERVHALLSDDCGDMRILIHPFDSRALFTYNIDTRTWDLFDEWFLDNWPGMAVAVNGVLFCCLHSNVYAYDLLKRKRFSKPVRGFENYKDSLQRNEDYPPAYLFHIGGGKLCLLWSPMNRVTAICTIFTVERHEPLSGGGEPDFVAHIVSVKRYYADGPRGPVTNCLAL